MRIDKFLKVSRLIKRRTVANDACGAHRIAVSGKIVKASYEVKQGDVIEITIGGKAIKAQVMDITAHTLKEDAAQMYKIIE